MSFSEESKLCSFLLSPLLRRTSPKYVKRSTQILYQYLGTKVAPPVGLEPTTTRLTAECSTIELWRNILFQKPPEPAARKLLISSSSECHPTSILQTPFLLTGTFRNLRSCLRQPPRPLLSAFVPSGFCSFRDFRNKRVGETKVSPTQWNPATTYPPGPFPAKYYQRVEA